MMHKPLSNQTVRLLLIALPLLSLLWLMRAGLAREQQPDLRWVVRQLEPDDVVDLAAPQDDDTTTVAEAAHPETGHIYRLDLAQQTLEEMDDAGQVLASYPLPQLNVQSVSDMRFETSIDATDDPRAVHLYVWAEGHVFEMWPVSVSEVAPAAPQQQAALVRTTETFEYQPPSPDPAGLTYLTDWRRLLISDSEVSEMYIYEGVNLFFTTRSGNLRDRADTTDFTDEPTGVAFNSHNDRLFITDDDEDTIFEVSLLCEDDDDDDDVPDDVSADDVSGDDVSDDDVSGDDDCDDGMSVTVPTGDDDDYYFNSFRTDFFGNDDPEGITYAADQGVLYTADGRHREVFRISPGPNGRFGDENDEVSSFDLGDLGLVDPEGIAYEPRSGNLFIVDSNVDSLESTTPTVYEVSTDGVLVRTIDISQANPMKPAGIVLAPASDGSGNIHLYVVDRGVDNNVVPTENDGRLYEFSLPDDIGTPTPTLTISPTGTPPPSGTQPPQPTATPTGTLTPDPSGERIYMPLIARNIHDEVGEPNNICERAYPIATGQAQAFLAEDRDDWYRFELGQDANLTVLLDNFVPQDGQIAVYRGSDCATAMFLDNNGDSSTQKTVNLGNQPAGTYLVYVGNDGPLNQDDFYTLMIAVD